MAFYMSGTHIPSENTQSKSPIDGPMSKQIELNYLNFMNRFDVLLEIRCSRESVVTRLTNKLFVIILMNFLDVRV
jgi:hypothetical protein